MATYYVRTDGLDTNTGTGPATNQAWKTIQKALGATGITGGDTVYIAPGKYVEAVTIGGTYTSSTFITGDPNAQQFSGLTPGVVRISGYATDNASATVTNVLISGTANNLKFSGLQFESSNNNALFITGTNIGISKCQFVLCSGYHGSTTNGLCRINAPTSTAANATIEQCIFLGARFGLYITGQNLADSTVVRNCVLGLSQYALYTENLQCSISNCYIYGSIVMGVLNSGSNSFPSSIRNCVIQTCSTGVVATNSTQMVESYIRYIACSSARSGVIAGTGSTTEGVIGIDFGYQRMNGMTFGSVLGTQQNSVNQSYGTATNAPVADIFGIPWSGSSPDAGVSTFYNVSGITSYNPTERNASTITIAPGSTSQSIELYLGATGLTASTAGLSARYNRTRTASVDIPLVARTIAQAWTSGGFAEVDSTNMPGIYRLDVPDAALAAGADDVTVVVRGASGTNGAVMTVKLSSGGLTAAQTAAAVWDEPYSTHTTAATFGSRTLKTVADNRLVNVGTANHIEANVHAIVDSAPAASELSGALLHNGTDYISADLLTPVSAATSVHIGPYQLLADGLGADQPLDVNVGTATSIDVQVTDANGTGIDITGATVSAKVYNSGGTLVATYNGTATYADNGRLSFGLTTTVTATSGTYTVTVTRTTGATDTQIFGPLRLYVRPV